MAFHLCIDLSDVNIPLKGHQAEAHILHVKFHGTDRDEYRVDYEKLESTLLTEYLKQRDGPDFHQKLIKLTFNITPVDEANAFCQSVLERGIFCRQSPYFFLGHSDEQLKEKSCYLMRASHEEIHELLSKFGNFLEEKNLAKRASKIAMLFSGLNRTVPLQAHEYKVEPDIKGGVVRSYNFTDGCGFMSPNFASELQQIFELNYKPSAVHIRYRGIEGVLCLKDDLTEVKVQFHKSMQKFFTPDENMPRMFNFVDVVDYSRPYVNGYLNSQMVMLLVERGVSAQNLEDLQDGFHELVEGMCNKTAEYFLSFKGEFRLLQEIQENGIDSGVRNRLKLLQKQELDDMGMAAYTRVLVPKSRVVFAVCDPLHKLKYGECYFSPTTPGEEARNFPIGQKLLVTRSPCYVPGDLRVLKLTNDREGYENLKDCLVLPARGPRPHAFECSGGDLSGKKFFVCWDKKIIPSGNQKPCDYSPTKGAKLRRTSSKSLSKVTEKFKRNDHGKEVKHREEMLQYFATYTDETQQKIEREYMKYATSNGPSSKECRRLSKMLHQATNFTKDANDFEKQLEEAEQPISSELPSYSLSNRLSCVFSTDAEQSVNEIMRMIDNKAKVFFERMQFETKKSEA
ncbi:probable RNA-dependent RNA polymerase 1 [Stylophora pistillata]|uniref:probable RNA-dependent RNA polymerase 1 n=1 Tax=Stylophora pistillata TaxID=50429 RepID=UPI000C05169F|nr:probable RNA-dependent RNA polymerase 1 [Stylophora pistillata]XP_022793092.1 probable RNA-dependent RNA polymerase 1 [Stylophora pistillata]XP_022793093.1 probable RNA-dependent RNA polymerase 1 [Stylophora pistillata]XP_022793094.1 probable RNA-dependent RNA polymerase 1 [Stylophora pistillata]